MQHPIPVQKDWPTDIKIKALAHYLHLVTADPLIKLDYASGSGTQGPDGGNRFIAALVKTRYAHFGLDPWVDGLAEGVNEAERKWREIERWELGREDDAEDFALCLDNAEVPTPSYLLHAARSMRLRLTCVWHFHSSSSGDIWSATRVTSSRSSAAGFPHHTHTSKWATGSRYASPPPSTNLLSSL
jgi:hypothetical protein